jgi:signal transduction histidine kinase
VWIALARGREDLDGLLGKVRRSFGWSFAGAVAVAILLVWLGLAAGLRPLHAIARQVERLDAESLGARVALKPTPRELQPVVDQINGLLARLQASFERERRFTGNVAHELRTPIAELRSLADVGGAWPDDRASVEAFFGDVRAIAGRMERLVADLLLLARCQAGVEKVETRATSLRQAVEEAWAAVARNGTARPFAPELPRDLVLQTDPGKLDIILLNLLGNAVAYSPPRSEVRCVGTAGGGKFRIEVSNLAEPLTPEDLRNMAAPFWRKDEARASEQHSGLGLSLVAALAGLLGLDFQVAQDPDGRFRACLEGGVGGPGGE